MYPAALMAEGGKHLRKNCAIVDFTFNRFFISEILYCNTFKG